MKHVIDTHHSIYSMRSIVLMICLFCAAALQAQPIMVAGQPGRLEIRVAGEHSLRITLKPAAFKGNYPFTPALTTRTYPPPFISIAAVDKKIAREAAGLRVVVTASPLTITVSNKMGRAVQQFILMKTKACLLT